MVAIVVGGAFFGDNLSFISDTTIAATKTQGCEMRDKFKVNSLIVMPAFVYIAERRWHRRSKPEQTLKVYSNALEVELFVNGVSMGTRTGVNGVFTWDKIRLKEGINNIEARSDSGIDYTQIEIVEDKIHHGII